MPCTLLAAALALAACAPAHRPLVAEVYYDATGDDTGLEFVELSNPGDTTATLAGMRLEAGDGSAPARWTLRWTGDAGDAVPPRGRFVVGGARVVPAPQAVVTLELQNGPDAVRLVWPDGAVEVVGWGAHEFGEYACGAPAPDVPSGWSLARVPDDADGGANALDFRAATPSPGRANRAARDAALVAGSLALEPEQPEPGAAARLRARVTGAGAELLTAGVASLRALARSEAGAEAAAERALGALAPEDTLDVVLDLPPLPAGRWRLTAAIVLAGDEVSANDADSLLARVGPGPLEVTEIQFHPAAGEGEWVEVRNRSGAALDLAAFTLADCGATRARIAGPAVLAPDSLAVLAQTRAALLARIPALDTARVWEARPWPALNNADDTAGVADHVVLRDSDGVPSQRVAYSAAGVPAGVPLEWRDGGWWPAATPVGTPVAPPGAPPALASRFTVEPARLAGTAREVRLAWALPWERGRVAVDLFDLAGRRIGRALDEALVPARGAVTWRATGLSPGLYVLALRARASSGGGTLTESRVLRIAGVMP
jgi:hypothetical protein